jgi:hypothetical protein
MKGRKKTSLGNPLPCLRTPVTLNSKPTRTTERVPRFGSSNHRHVTCLSLLHLQRQQTHDFGKEGTASNSNRNVFR